MQANEFRIGGRYRNRQQGYEVLNIADEQMEVRFDDGTTAIINDLEIAARIASNIARDEARRIPPGVPNGRAIDFAWTLGVIARHGELHAEVPPQSWDGFEEAYSRITGEVAGAQPLIMRITHGGYNKWGCELRIYIPARFCNDQRFVLPVEINCVSANVPERRRINSNAFWWFLVERLHFKAGSQQDLSRIRNQLSEELRQAFQQGTETH